MGPYFVWAIFDGTTNAPVVFPSGTTMEELASRMLVQITPAELTGSYFAGIPLLPVTFTAAGGGFAPPFTWSASGLPNGVALSAGGVLSGTPQQAGTFDFVITLTDAFHHVVTWKYIMEIQ